MKKQMVKKIAFMMSVLLILGTLLSACGSSGNDTGNSDEVETIRWIICVPSEIPSDVDRIEAAVNKILVADCQAQIDLQFMSYSDFFSQISLILSDDEADLVSMISAMAPSFVEQGMLLDMSPYLDEYGQGIVDSFNGDKDFAYACQINGMVYGIPLHKDTAMQTTLFFRTDIVEKYNLDVSSIQSLADLDALYEQLSVEEPDMWMLSVDNTGNGYFEQMDTLDNRIGVLENPTESTEVVDITTTENFQNFCSYMYKWNQKGWLNSGASTDSESYYSYIASGQAFSFISNYGHPLSENDQEANCGGVDLTMVTIGEPLMTTASINTWVQSIPAQCHNPAKVVEVMSYMANSKEINNILNWGEEGVDWEYKEDGRIGYPDGVTADNVGYHLNCGWQLPNQFLCDTWEDMEPGIYQEMEAYNETAVSSKAVGFTFDPEPVQDQIANCNNVVSKYYKALICGALDPEEAIPQFQEELKAAGQDEVIAEKQRQLDEFLASK